MPSAGKAFQRSSAQGRKFAHTRPQSIRRIKAIALKQNKTKYSAMLQRSETKLFIHHWNHAWHSTKDFFQLHEFLIWWHLNLQVQARVDSGGKSTHLETSGYAWICLANAALLVSVWGQKQISYFSSKCTGVNARCFQGLLQSSECSIWPFWNKGARQIAGLWPPQVL